MATLITPGAMQITVSVDNPDRDDLGGMLIWMSTSSGFTPDSTPGTGNLVYNGPDLLVPLTKDVAGSALVAGTAYYLKLALYSQIDPDDYDLSTEYSATPTAPTAAVEDLTGDTIRGKNVFAGSFGTKGSTLTASTVLAAATVNVKDTSDFPSSGSAIIIGPTNDRDSFTYTGKTATTLTGCSGVQAHPAGYTVAPLNQQLILIDAAVNEVRTYGNRGDGTFEELASIGARASGADVAIATFGGNNYSRGYAVLAENTSATVAAIKATNYGNGPSIEGVSTTGHAIHGETTGSGRNGVFGESTTGAAVRGASSGTGAGVSGRSTNGPGLESVVPSGGLVRAQLYLDPNASLPSGTSVDGDVAMVDGGRMYVYDGAAFREVLKVESSTFGTAASGSTVSLTAPPQRYINTGAAKAALTFNLPASPVNGQPFEICTVAAITTVAIRDSAGVAGNVLNAPTTLAAGGFCKFEYRNSNTTWYRVG